MTTPVIIVGGFLGAGKTTFLMRLLGAPQGRRLAVIVNDFGDLNIDAALVSRVTDDTIELTNGCLCCSARGDLLIAAKRLMLREPQPDGVIIEASGVARPDVVARCFVESEFDNHFDVQTILALVDTEGFGDLDFEAGELVIDQAAVADLVLLNKTDSAGEENVQMVRSVLREAIPYVRMIETIQADVPLELIFEETHEHPVTGLADQPDASERFEALTWRSDVALDLRAFRRALDRMSPDIYRLKGFLHVADDPERRLLVQMVGRRGSIEPLNPWAGPAGTALVAIARKGALSQSDLAEIFEACAAGPRLDRAD